MRISDWSSDVCSSDLRFLLAVRCRFAGARTQYRPGDEPRAGEPCAFRPRYLRSEHRVRPGRGCAAIGGWRCGRHSYRRWRGVRDGWWGRGRSEEHTSELQSLMRISYAVFCLKKKKKTL